MLMLAAFVMLRGYSVSGRGLSWINTSSFEDSVRFSQMVSDDIAAIRRLAVLQNAFEDDGELDDGRLLVSAQTVNGSITYTAADIISIAKGFGYTIDNATHSVNYTSSTDGSNSANNYQVRVTFKLYDPYYFDNIIPGPSQGVMSIRDLCIEVLRALSEYYSLSAVYAPEESNFKYYACFDSNYDEELIVTNLEDSAIDAASYGRYIRIDSSNNVDTNISPVPDNIMPDGRSFAYGNTDGNVLEVCVDTTYIYNDRYKTAAAEYMSYIREAYYWLTAFGIGAVLMLISLVLVVRDRSFAKSGRIYAIDRLPLEGMFVVLGFASVFVYVMFRAGLYNFMDTVLPEDEWGFCCTVVKTADIYAFLVAGMCSMYRRSCRNGVFADSLINRAMLAVSDEDNASVWSTLTAYGIYILINVICIGGGVYCITNSMFNRYYYFAAVMLFVLAAAADIFAYIAVYSRNKQRGRINSALKRISEGDVSYAIDETGFTGGELEAVRSINSISDGLSHALNEQVKADRLKADLITNVSHDIKTPLTSIINYVDLIKRENIDNERVRSYIDVLDKKSARLKNLTEDLVEASKASSGNIKMDMCRLDMAELAVQAGGEFDDKFAARQLEFNLDTGNAPAFVWADGRHLWRVFENLLNNAAKYAMPNTRIYAEVSCADGKCTFSVKNISESRLNISPDELTERFIRGDVSRSTEGSGLGLNIAKSLTRLMGGELIIEIDGDLYKAKVELPEYASQGETVPAAEGSTIIG